MTTTPSRNGIDLEVLAAFIEGTLDPIQRARVIEQLDRDEGAFELLSETLRNIESCEDSRLSERSRPRTVGQPSRRPVLAALAFGHRAEPRRCETGRRHHHSWATGAVIAAAAACLLIVTGVAYQLGTLTEGAGPESLFSAEALWASLAPTAVATELPSSSTVHGWPLTRGRGGRIDDEKRAFRLGVLVFDLHTALARGERAAVIELTHAVQALLEDVPFSEAMIASYQSVRLGTEQARPMEALLDLSSQTEAILEGIVDRRHFRFGKWCEATRLASRLGTTNYFSRPAFYEGWSAWVEADPALANVLSPVGGTSRRELATLEVGLARLIRDSGSLDPHRE